MLAILSKSKFLEANHNLASKTYYVYNFSKIEFSQHNLWVTYFLYFGRLSREKGLLTLLKAFKKLKGLRLIIVGDGELRKQLEEEKSINVDILGYKTGIELEKIIKNSFFVIASSECYETNSMVIVESYSNGKPVIGAKIGAIPELIIEYKTGFLFESKNLESLIKILSFQPQLVKVNMIIWVMMHLNLLKKSFPLISIMIFFKMCMNIQFYQKREN